MSSTTGNDPSVEQTFNKVQSEITELIDITTRYLQQQLPFSFRARLVYNTFNASVSKYADHFFKIQFDDIAQQVRIAYFTVLTKYFKKPSDYISDQFKLRLNYQATWLVRTWLNIYLKKLAREDIHPVLPSQPSVCMYSELDLGPAFLIKGTSVYPYSMLSNYDRLLIHLAFYEDMSDVEIGKALQRNRILVRRDIDRILDYLRRCYERKA